MPIHRPKGQVKLKDALFPIFQPTTRLDFELETVVSHSKFTKSKPMISLLHDAQLSALRSQIPTLVDATNMVALGGGLTNKNYRVDTEGGHFMMRVSDKTTSLLGINRANERVNTERAHRAGVGAALVDALPHENVLVVGWIEAKTLHAEDIHARPDLLLRIADSMKKLHAGPAFQGDFHFPTVRKQYLQTVLDAGYFMPDRYLAIESLVLQLEEVLTLTAEELVPCNNDLLAENFMDDGKKIWIVDYEYAGQNEASFEIGNFASEIALNDAQLTLFCDAYRQKHRTSKIARAKAWSMIARFGWVMWASIQEAVSPIVFDFRTWGLKKWQSVLPEFEGNRYEGILKILKEDAII